ncbi:MAG TPA: response regulator [Deltaproteobacteria bacterium]|nr:response regulator [Deltaproteobacteria bacterium]
MWSERKDSSDSSKERERALLDLLKKATDFYEDTIGILSGIFELTELVSRGSPEEDFYAHIANILIAESRCDNASVFIVENGRLRLRAAAGSNVLDANDEFCMDLGEGVAGRCAQEGKPVLISDVDDCDFFKSMETTRVNIRSMLCVPIKEGSNTLGVLNLSHSRQDFFNINYVRIFELLGLLVGQMLTLVHLHTIFQRRHSDLCDLLQQKDESLQNISERYKAVVDASEDMIFLLENDDTITFSNQRIYKVMGYIPESLHDIFNQETVALLQSKISAISVGESDNFEVSTSLGPNNNVIGQFFIKRIRQQQVLIMMKDITVKKRVEQRTMQTEKLTSLGLLTSGIAHELNNKLTPILGFADLLDVRKFSVRDKQRLSVIVNSANSAKTIVESLLKFSRNKPPEKVVFDMREIITRTVNLYTPIIKKRGIRIIHEDFAEPLFVKADMNCLEQVLVNFINNAIDAIDDREGSIWLRSWLVDNHVHVSIEDTGPGIPDEIVTKIFDPFFTTKSKDKGTGLGLSICYGIISDHKGSISLENTANGAVASIRIPAMISAEEDLVSEAAEETASKIIFDENKRSPIMVVEDEEDLLDLMVDSLSPYYDVMTFNDGRKAYDHLDEYAWELIISDLRMPVMDGMELYHEVIKKQPGLKKRFMFITGDTYDFEVKEFLENTGVVFLRKPFRIKELRDVVYKQINYR